MEDHSLALGGHPKEAIRDICFFSFFSCRATMPIHPLALRLGGETGRMGFEQWKRQISGAHSPDELKSADDLPLSTSANKRAHTSWGGVASHHYALLVHGLTLA